MADTRQTTTRLTEQDVQSLVALLEAGRLAEAEDRTRALIANFPRVFVLYNILGAALTAQRKLADAIACFRQALELNPQMAESHYNLGIALHDDRQFEQAIASYRRALTLKADYPDAHNNLGVALSDLGRIDEAVNCYRTALELAPNYAEAHNNLGAALQDQGRFEDAGDSFRRALALQPDYAEAHNNLGNVWQKLGQPDAAIASYRQALAHRPDYAEAHNNLGNAVMDRGDLSAAVFNYRRALEINADFAEAHGNLGNALRELGQTDAAVAHFETALALRPDHAETHNNYGIALKDLGRREEALDCYRRALELNPEYADAHVNMGGAYLTLGRYDEAIASYRAADPDCTRPNVSAAALECFYHKGDLEGFDGQLRRISRNQDYNFRAGAASAFAAQQRGEPNPYAFCDDPVDLVTVHNVLRDDSGTETLLRNFERDIQDEGWNQRFSPGHISAGYKSVGNLFDRDSHHARALDALLRRYIDRYFQTHRATRSYFIDNWPDEYDLYGWYIRLHQGGEISAHVHTGWVSGVLYLRVPESGADAGNIEFTLCGYGLPVRRDDYPRRMVTTAPGVLTLFPSTLPHRVVPFTADDERICIAFDMQPRRGG